MRKRRVVIKIGSSILTLKGRINKRFLGNLIFQVDKLLKNNVDICIVSSGAIVAGISLLGFNPSQKSFTFGSRDECTFSLLGREPRPKGSGGSTKIPLKINKLQAIASVGQVALMDVYNELFKKYKRTCGQILLTWDDFQDRYRYINAKNTFFTLFKQGIVPVVNENDTVSIQEIKFGDNDRLSALVAGLIEADTLLILSNVEGFYFKGNILREVKKINTQLFREVKKKNLFFTKGGMFSKLEAAQLATTFGIKTVIANGKEKDILLNIILNKKSSGTTFLPQKGISPKKRWIAYSRRAKGRIIIDKGAEKAIVERGGSLLSQGIKAVEGQFLRNDTVTIESEEGSILGWGLVQYNSDFLGKHIGKRLPSEVIHRDSLVIKEE